ncbi:MAG: hypothetical protein ACRD5G_04960 [Candidatus Acidiferrales bacterium]
MNQYTVIEGLCRWLQENRWSKSLRVRCDHVTEARETLGLYLGPKMARKGRSNQIAQVDVLVCNEESRTVELIVEVDPNPNPKKLLGDICSVFMADNYTESKSSACYKIDDTLVVFVTLLREKASSQKAEQFVGIEQALNTRLDLSRVGVRKVRLCYGSSEDQALARCCNVITREFIHPRRRPQESDPAPQSFLTVSHMSAQPVTPIAQNKLSGSFGSPVNDDDLYVSELDARAILRECILGAQIPSNSRTARCMFEPTKDSHGGTNCWFGRTPLWNHELRVKNGMVLRSEFMDWVQRLVESGKNYQKAGRASWD